MDLALDDKVALVTGASRGIGRAIALALAAEKARVVLCARNAADLDAAVREARACGGADAAAVGVTADVTTPAGVAAVVDAAVRAYGRLDVVVNNVGGSGARNFADTDDADLQLALDRNLFPALRVSRAALPHLRARGGGVIVMIASVWGRESGGGPSYNVAKAAEISLAKAMSTRSGQGRHPRRQRRARLGPVPRRRLGAPPEGRSRGHRRLRRARDPVRPLRPPRRDRRRRRIPLLAARRLDHRRLHPGRRRPGARILGPMPVT